MIKSTILKNSNALIYFVLIALIAPFYTLSPSLPITKTSVASTDEPCLI